VKFLLLLIFLLLLLIFLLAGKFLTLLPMTTKLNKGMRPGNEKFDIKFNRLLPHKFL